MLILAYYHPVDGDTEMVEGTIPTSPTAGYSHVNLDDFGGGFTPAQIDEVRFYCETNAHNRVIHFKTSNKLQGGAAWDGDVTGSSTSDWQTGFVPFSDHTGILPASTDLVYDGGFAATFLFGDHVYSSSYRWWAIRGRYNGNSYFRCDHNWGDTDHETLH